MSLHAVESPTSNKPDLRRAIDQFGFQASQAETLLDVARVVNTEDMHGRPRLAHVDRVDAVLAGVSALLRQLHADMASAVDAE